MFQLVYCVGGSLKNLCNYEMGGGGGVWQMLTSLGGGGGVRSMLKVADRGEGVKFVKILLTSYANAP